MKKSTRRALCLALLAALVFSVPALTQAASAPAKTVTLGILQFAEHPSLDDCRNGFIEGMKQGGYVEGTNLIVNYQNAQADMATDNAIATNFIGSTDIICAIATPSAQAAFNAAQGNTPVIFTAVSDPIAAQLANADGTAIAGITGVSDALPVDAQLQLIRTMLPNAKKIGILYSTSEVNSESQLTTIKAAAPNYGFEISASGVTSSAEIQAACDALFPTVDCVMNITDNLVVSSLPVLLDKAAQLKIPVFGSEVQQVKSGCLASAGINYFNLGIQAGLMAAQVLSGTDIKTIPFEIVKQNDLFINQNAANALGIAVSPDLASKAIMIVDGEVQTTAVTSGTTTTAAAGK